VVNWNSSCVSFFRSACIAATYIFTAPTCTTTIIILESRAIIAEFQHFIPRFNTLELANVCVPMSCFLCLVCCCSICKVCTYFVFCACSFVGGCLNQFFALLSFHNKNSLLALPTKQGKDIVLIFIIEYSSLRDFGPQVVGLFLYEDFWNMIFWLVLKLENSYRVNMISWRILVSFRGFFLKIIFLHGEIFKFP